MYKTKERLSLATLLVLLSVLALSASQPATAGTDEQAVTRVEIAGHPATVTASSELGSKSGRYQVANAFDGDPETAWVEGVDGTGIGEYLELSFDEPVTLDGFTMLPGYAKDDEGDFETYTANAAPREVMLEVDGKEVGRYTIPYDLYFGIAPEFPDDGCYHVDDSINYSPRMVILSKPVEGSTFRLTVNGALNGRHYDDLAISEWRPLLAGQSQGKSIQVLIDLRDEEQFARRLIPYAEVEDLRLKYIHRDPGLFLYIPLEYLIREASGRWDPGEDLAGYFPRVERPVDPYPHATPSERFLRYTRHAFLDVAVTLEFEFIKGASAFHYGDGEWVDFYPVIQLDRENRIVSLREEVEYGAAPGCRAIIPLSIKEWQ